MEVAFQPGHTDSKVPLAYLVSIDDVYLFPSGDSSACSSPTPALPGLKLVVYIFDLISQHFKKLEWL